MNIALCVYVYHIFLYLESGCGDFVYIYEWTKPMLSAEWTEVVIWRLRSAKRDFDSDKHKQCISCRCSSILRHVLSGGGGSAAGPRVSQSEFPADPQMHFVLLTC